MSTLRERRLALGLSVQRLAYSVKGLTIQTVAQAEEHEDGAADYRPSVRAVDAALTKYEREGAPEMTGADLVDLREEVRMRAANLAVQARPGVATTSFPGPAPTMRQSPAVEEVRAQMDAIKAEQNEAVQRRSDERHARQRALGRELQAIREGLGLSRPEMASLLGLRTGRIIDSEAKGSQGVDALERLLVGYQAIAKLRSLAAPPKAGS